MALALFLVTTAAAGQNRGPDETSPADLGAAIDKLGDFDFGVRSRAAQAVRRAPVALAVPALVGAVTGHTDGYVRFRALVLATGFSDPRVRDVAREVITDPNDRLRAVAYGFFEANPDPDVVPILLRALEREESEFVRPSLVRALAAQSGSEKVRAALLREAERGQDFFRSAVIEALGNYRADYAVPVLTAIAAQEGPLQQDAALALGRIGDKRSLQTLAQLQQSAPKTSQPAIAAAICLLGVNCESHGRFIVDTLTFGAKNPGFQELVRAAAAALAAVAVRDRPDALASLIEIGLPLRDPERAPVALAIGTVALRNTPLTLAVLEKRPDLPQAAELLREAFDMLEEDLQEERFFVTVRRAYWQAPEGSTTRALGETLIGTLEF